MNADIFQGHWKEAQSELKKQWNKLTDQDLQTIKNDNEQLAGTLQKYYGYTKDQAKSMIDEFKENFKSHSHKNGHDKEQKHDNGMMGGLNEAAQKVSEVGKEAYKKTKEMAEHLKENAGECGKAVADFVEKKPYQSLAIAALAGLVIGLLIKKS